MKFKFLTICIAFFAVFLLSMEQLAEAKRFGGGSSFGSKPTVSNSSGSKPTISNSSRPSPTTSTTIGGATTTTATKPGFGSTGFGIMSGLLAGTFLGAMLAGSPLGDMGGILDIILLLVLAFVGYKIFQAFRSRNTTTENNYDTTNTQQHFQQENRSDSAPTNIFEKPETSDPIYDNTYQDTAPIETYGLLIPEFLQGAKAAFNRMQASWDKRDLEDIKAFTTQTVYDEIAKQMAEDEDENSVTKVLNLQADVVGITKIGEALIVTVHFNAYINEEQGKMGNTVNEYWNFKRENDKDSWKIDGVSQVNQI